VSGTPDLATPGSTTPGSTTPGSTTPGSTTPGSTTPGSTTPGSTTPGSFVATVPEALAGMRVDRVVSMLAGVSRAAARDLVAGGHVFVAGRPVRQRSTAVAAGSELAVEQCASRTALEPDVTVPFEVVHADADLVVVEKPPGVVVHPGAGQSGGTLIAGLVSRFPDISALSSISDPARPGVVHRLDKGTSGLLVVARTARAYRALVAQMGARSVGRRYLALVTGTVAEERGLVDAPIGRSTRTPTKMAVTPAGRPARTRYAVEARAERLFVRGEWTRRRATLLACTLETGRTHQIRVHLAAVGHPVIGDDRYGSASTRGVLAPGRLFLHASALSFDHPASGERMSWRSPLPVDLREVLEGTSTRTSA
jgi:23S rRNA pseudouridine1911/1915/1917 synthase